MVRCSTFVSFAIHIMIFNFQFVLNCNQPIMQRTLMGYHCSENKEHTFLKNVSNAQQWECFILCQHLKECYFYHYNVNGKYCLLSSKLCTDLERNIDYILYTFGTDHSNCFIWETTDGNTFQNGIQVHRPREDPLFVSRAHVDGYWYPGKTPARTKCKTVVNGIKVITAKCEVLDVLDSCVPYLSWIVFSKVEERALPLGAVVGGHHPVGYPLYIAKGTIGANDISIGYYDDQSGLGYFIVDGKVKTSGEVYILTMF